MESREKRRIGWSLVKLFKPGAGDPEQGREEEPASMPNRPAKPMIGDREKQSPEAAQQLGNPYWLRSEKTGPQDPVGLDGLGSDPWYTPPDGR
jgi:hypothetical protein